MFLLLLLVLLNFWAKNCFGQSVKSLTSPQPIKCPSLLLCDSKLLPAGSICRDSDLSSFEYDKRGAQTYFLVPRGPNELPYMYRLHEFRLPLFMPDYHSDIRTIVLNEVCNATYKNYIQKDFASSFTKCDGRDGSVYFIKNGWRDYTQQSYYSITGFPLERYLVYNPTGDNPPDEILYSWGYGFPQLGLTSSCKHILDPLNRFPDFNSLVGKEIKLTRRITNFPKGRILFCKNEDTFYRIINDVNGAEVITKSNYKNYFRFRNRDHELYKNLYEWEDLPYIADASYQDLLDQARNPDCEPKRPNAFRRFLNTNVLDPNTKCDMIQNVLVISDCSPFAATFQKKSADLPWNMGDFSDHVGCVANASLSLTSNLRIWQIHSQYTYQQAMENAKKYPRAFFAIAKINETFGYFAQFSYPGSSTFPIHLHLGDLKCQSTCAENTGHCGFADAYKSTPEASTLWSVYTQYKTPKRNNPNLPWNIGNSLRKYTTEYVGCYSNEFVKQGTNLVRYTVGGTNTFAQIMDMIGKYPRAYFAIAKASSSSGEIVLFSNNLKGYPILKDTRCNTTCEKGMGLCGFSDGSSSPQSTRIWSVYKLQEIVPSLKSGKRQTSCPMDPQIPGQYYKCPSVNAANLYQYSDEFGGKLREIRPPLNTIDSDDYYIQIWKELYETSLSIEDCSCYPIEYDVTIKKKRLIAANFPQIKSLYPFSLYDPILPCTGNCEAIFTPLSTCGVLYSTSVQKVSEIPRQDCSAELLFRCASDFRPPQYTALDPKQCRMSYINMYTKHVTSRSILNHCELTPNRVSCNEATTTALTLVSTRDQDTLRGMWAFLSKFDLISFQGRILPSTDLSKMDRYLSTYDKNLKAYNDVTESMKLTNSIAK